MRASWGDRVRDNSFLDFRWIRFNGILSADRLLRKNQAGLVAQTGLLVKIQRAALLLRVKQPGF
ncbi:hypothetical protein QUB63_00510 [Microcoleus sp. ARI1-B5]|uniref:hypothetical protein n=1 Tax=unclassified Microcoleus TaxID=2642155 RepID=UPI002FD4070F